MPVPWPAFQDCFPNKPGCQRRGLLVNKQGLCHPAWVQGPLVQPAPGPVAAPAISSQVVVAQDLGWGSTAGRPGSQQEEVSVTPGCLELADAASIKLPAWSHPCRAGVAAASANR